MTTQIYKSLIIDFTNPYEVNKNRELLAQMIRAYAKETGDNDLRFYANHDYFIRKDNKVYRLHLKQDLNPDIDNQPNGVMNFMVVFPQDGEANRRFLADHLRFDPTQPDDNACRIQVDKPYYKIASIQRLSPNDKQVLQALITQHLLPNGLKKLKRDVIYTVVINGSVLPVRLSNSLLFDNTSTPTQLRLNEMASFRNIASKAGGFGVVKESLFQLQINFNADNNIQMMPVFQRKVVKTMTAPTPQEHHPHWVNEVRKESYLEQRLMKDVVVNSPIFRPSNHGQKAHKVMDKIPGESLDRYVNAHYQFHVDQVLSIATSLAEQLDHVHQGLYIHRDVKPANVIFDAQTNKTQLIDFGVAEDRRKRLANGSGTYTFQPMAIRQTFVTGQQLPPTRRTDTHGLLVLTANLILGERIFSDFHRAKGNFIQANTHTKYRLEGLKEKLLRMGASEPQARRLSSLIHVINHNDLNSYPSHKAVLEELKTLQHLNKPQSHFHR